MRQKSLAVILLASIIAGSLSSCAEITGLLGMKQGDNGGGTAAPRGITGSVTTGSTTAGVSVPVGDAGGVIEVTDPGDPLKGLRFDVPAGAFAEDRNLKLSHAPIQSHTFGAGLNPISPMIAVDVGGGYADEFIEVTVPIALPEGHFAMGFYYDEIMGKLEGIPVSELTSTSITLLTCRFLDFFIGSIDETLLKEDIDTGFRPGIDDWQFVNRGSAVAKSGHCAGQSVTAMWYYCEQPDGAGATLWNRYDNNGKSPKTPDIWEDDSYAYRFASVVQNDIRWNEWDVNFMQSLRGASDRLTWNLFAYSMMMTGEPQYVGLSANAGGHAMICYRINQGNLYIADPNYPGDTGRHIDYKDRKFTPYESGANAEEIAQGKSIKFDRIGYHAKTAMVDWNLVALRWQEMKKGTIGSGIFPAYDIFWVDAKGKPQNLQDGAVMPDKKVEIRVVYKADPGSWYNPFVYRDGKKLQLDDRDKIELNPGKNVLGFHIFAAKYSYVDFKYVTVNFGAALAIDPPELAGKMDVEYTFTAVTDAAVKSPRFDWQLSGTKAQSSPDDTFTVSFPKPGDFTLSVSLVDSETETILATATAPVKIDSPADSGGDEGFSGKEAIRIVNPPPQSQLTMGHDYAFDIEMDNVVVDEDLGNPVVVVNFGDGTVVESPFGRRVVHRFVATGPISVTAKLYYGDERYQYAAMSGAGYQVVSP